MAVSPSNRSTVNIQLVDVVGPSSSTFGVCSEALGSPETPSARKKTRFNSSQMSSSVISDAASSEPVSGDSANNLVF